MVGRTAVIMSISTPTITPIGAPDTCPRCRGPFVCGAAGPEPCACTTVTLSAELQAALRPRYTGCLCMGCLRELAQPGAAVDCGT